MKAIDLMSWYKNHRTWCVIGLLLTCTLLAMILRRPDQWAAPYLWIEEGTLMLPDFIATGWRTLFHPVNGYFLVPTKAILAVSTTLSFRWLPEIEYWLTLMFTAGVLAAVAFTPTQLRFRVACALALLALPTDSEVFAMSSLVFWWGSVLTVLPLLWRRDAPPLPILRSSLLIVGGLSSPLVIALLPLYLLRAALQRSRWNWLDFGTAILVAGIQESVMPMTSQTTMAAFLQIPPVMFLRKFFGYFVYVPAQYGSHEGATLFAGVCLLAALAVCAWRYRRELSPAFYWLLAAFLLAAAASSVRVTLIQLHPALAGPRYFFLPFTFLFWAVLQLLAVEERFPRVVVVAVLALVLRNALDVGQRDSDHFDWRAQVAQCIGSERHEFPIGYDGRAVAAWKVELKGADCRRLVQGSWLDNSIPSGNVSP
jgi:hypothetical protein